MKKLLPLIALTVAASAFAQQQQPQWTIQNIGQSQKPAPQVAACIAKSWADKSQQQVISQAVLANDMAMDVYVPGQQPPNGAAAIGAPGALGRRCHLGGLPLGRRRRQPGRRGPQQLPVSRAAAARRPAAAAGFGPYRPVSAPCIGLPRTPPRRGVFLSTARVGGLLRRGTICAASSGIVSRTATSTQSSRRAGGRARPGLSGARQPGGAGRIRMRHRPRAARRDALGSMAGAADGRPDSRLCRKRWHDTALRHLHRYRAEPCRT